MSFSAPAQQAFFEAPGGGENHQHDDEDQENDSEHQRAIEGALGEGHQIAEPAAGGDELADDSAGEGEADRDLQTAQQPGGDRGQIDMPHQ